MEEKEKFDIIFFEEHFANGRCRYEKNGCSVSVLELDDSYSVRSEPAFPEMVCTNMTYFADTLTLKSEGQYLKNGGTKIGVWKSYDRFGELAEETDYEEGWNVDWKRLLPLLGEEGIDLDAIVSISRFFKEGSSGEKSPFWRVGVLATNEMVVEYTFDGLTGQRLPIDFVKIGD